MFIDHETIRITRNGDWLSNGEPITHESTLQAYQYHLGRDTEGYFIQIGKDFKRVEVEDTAFFVRQIRFEGDRIHIQLSHGGEEPLDVQTLKYSPGRLVCRLLGRVEEAKFLAQPYHELLLRAELKAGHYVLPSGLGGVTLASSDVT